MPSPGYIGVSPADRDPTVSDDSVTTAKIQDAAVTAAKFATTGTASSTTFLRGDMAWTANAGGDVVGPGSSTDDALARFDTTTGKLIQNSTATLSDAGTLTATAFAGALTGNVTGNASGTAATVTGAAQTAITSLAATVVINTSGAITTTGAFTSLGIDDNADALAMTIDSSERVGIGTTTPATNTKLDIEGGQLKVGTAGGSPGLTSAIASFWAGNRSINAGASIHVMTSDSVAADKGGSINLGGNYSGTSNSIDFAQIAGRSEVGSTLGYMALGTRGASATVERIRITSDGDVQTHFQAYAPEQQLSFNATQTWDVRAAQVCRLVLTANVTSFAAPTNQKDGAFYSVMVEQDGTGGWTVSWHTTFKWAGGTAPVVTTTASAKDIFVFRSDGTNMYEVGRQLNVS